MDLATSSPSMVSGRRARVRPRRAAAHSPVRGRGRGASSVPIVARRVFVGVFGESAFVAEAAAEPAAAARLRALPARRAVARAEMGHLVETRSAGVAVAGEAALGFRDLDIAFRQLIEETRRHVDDHRPCMRRLAAK